MLYFYIFFVDRFFASYIVALFGVFVLAFFSPSIEVPLSRITQVSPFSIGEIIHLQAVVEDTHKFSGGSISLIVTDGSGEIKTFIPASVVKGIEFDLVVGQHIEFLANVELYRGVIELKVDSPEKIWLN